MYQGLEAVSCSPVPQCTAWVKIGLGLTGDLGRAWVGAWVSAWMPDGGGGCGDVLWGWEKCMCIPMCHMTMLEVVKVSLRYYLA